MSIQHILYDRRSRDCLEDMFVSVAAGLGRRHELLYAKSWGFSFTGNGSQSGPPIGGALNAAIGSVADPGVLRLVARFNGLEVRCHPPGNDLVELASEAVAAGTPLILRREEMAEGQSPFLLLTKLDDCTFYHLNYDVGKTAGTSAEVGRGDVVQLASWKGAAYTFKTVPAEKLSRPFCCETIHGRSTVHSRAEDSWKQIHDFAQELAKMPDLAYETSGFSNQFGVPLFYQLMRVSQGRYQFAELLNYFGDGLVIRDFSTIARDLRRVGQGWNLVRSLLIKASLTREPAALLRRIGAKAVELADAEQDLCGRLDRACQATAAGVGCSG